MTGPASRRAILGSLAALPALTVPALAVPGPSDLARACDWAIDHVAWVNSAVHCPEDWPDERLDAELARTEVVFARAANEPSRSGSDLAAKARLLIMDMGQELRVSGYVNDKAMLRLLEEVAELCA